MPPKIRELIGELESKGFRNRGGKGSHRNFKHPKRKRPLTISGKLGEDAEIYQIKDVRNAIKEVKGK
ncbi:MAG: type II toxin-antitoxin system HicA family toxin [Acidobacteriota bacterium]